MGLHHSAPHQREVWGQSWERSSPGRAVPAPFPHPGCPLTKEPVESECQVPEGPAVASGVTGLLLPTDPALLPALLLAQVQSHHRLVPHLLWLHIAELL